MSGSLSATLAEAARRFEDRPALVTGSCVVTFRQLDTLAHEVGAWLSSLDIRRDSDVEPEAPPVVALMLPPCPEHHALLAGAARAGWITAGVNRRLADQQRAAALAVLDPDVLVTTTELAAPGRWYELLIEPADQVDDLADACRVRGSTCDDAATGARREVTVVMTSGTTGVPKGAVFANRQLDVIRRTDVGDRWGGGGANLMATELVHIGAMTKLAGTLQSGTTTHLLPHWEAGAALDMIERERMPVVGGISAQVALMLRHPSIGERDFSAVSLVVAGGGASDPHMIREATSVFGAPYAVRYSATESGGLGCAITFDGSESDKLLSTVGPPREGFEIRVGPSPDESLPVDETGQVWLRSPAMMDRWWGDPEATVDTIHGTWLRMGDHGRLDEAGRLTLAGRSDDGWVRGGYNVHPYPIEQVLRAHPQVADVAVVARPDPVMGEVGVAIVVAAGSSEGLVDELLDHAVEHLARHEVPAKVMVVDELPLTSLHKVDRAALRELTRPVT